MKRLCLLVCSSYRQEVVAALAEEGCEDVVVAAFASQCGQPVMDPDDLLKSLPDDFGPDDTVHVLGGGCLRGMPDPTTVQGHWRIHRMELCHELLAGSTLCRSMAAQGAYLLSAGWLGTWREHMQKWGFDETTARDFFGESARSLLLLDTGVHPQAAEDLAACADYVGLPARTLPVGTDHLRLYLSRIVLQWRSEHERVRQQEQLARMGQELAEYGMSLDLLARFNKVLTEEETIRQFLEMCRMLFAPREMAFLLQRYPGLLLLLGPEPLDRAGLEAQLLQVTGDFGWTEGKDGFMVRASFEGHQIGVLLLRGFAMPQHTQRYLNVTLSLVRVLGLALSGAQAHQGLQLANEELEQRVQGRTAQLEAANQDLEKFCYMISHELRAPLARLQGFSGMIQASAQAQDWQQTEALAERLAISSLRTRDVIDGLLTLTRLSLDDLHRSPVDLSLLSRQVLDILAQGGQKLPGHIVIAEELVVAADPGMLSLALGHLIGNAVKFTAKTPEGCLSIGRVPGTLPMTLFVKDNGVGFDMGHADKLFTPFCRMHAAKDFDGSGLGLAIVRKIVERHGGRIWAESSPGQGATFYFSLGEA